MKEFFRENKEIILPAGLFLIVLVLFGRIVFNSFAYDDLFITFNWVIKAVINPFYYFIEQNTLEVYIPGIQDVYRPLGVWFFSLEYRLFELDPFYFHLINLFLHAANVLLLFFLLKKILSAQGGSASGGKNDVLSFLGALFFAIHPGTPETVAWAIQQYSLWSWFFCFLALNLLFTEESNENLFLNKKWKKIVLLAIFSFSAVFFKEHAVILPLIYILCVLTFKMGIKKRLGEITAVTLPVILYIVLRGAVLGAYSQMEPWGIGRYKIFLTMLKGFVYYFRLLVWPHPLSINYDSFPLEKNPFSANVIFSAIFLFLIILSAIIMWRKRPLFSLGIFWVFIDFGPVSNFILPMKQIINERFLYFALPGFIISLLSIVIFTGEKVANYKKFLIPSAISFVILASLIFSWLTFIRLGDWKNNLTLWKREAEIKPNSWRTQINYGVVLEKENRTEEAIEHYEKALAIARRNENKSSTIRTLAEAHLRINEQEKAKTILLAGLKQFPGNEVILFGLAKTYLLEKEYEKAGEIFKSLAVKNNDDTSAFFAVLSEKLNGGKDEDIKKALEEIKNPRLREQSLPLILAREEMIKGKWQEGAFSLNQILQNSPTPISEVYLWLAEAYEKINEKESALGIYQMALALFPDLAIEATQGTIRNNQ